MALPNVKRVQKEQQPVKLSEGTEPCGKLGCTSLAVFGYRLCRPHIEDWRKSKEASEKVYDLRPLFEQWRKR